MAMCRTSTVENTNRHKGKKKKAKNVVSKSIREKAEEALSELQDSPNGMFCHVKILRINSKGVEGGRWMRGNDEKLCFSENERGKIQKDYMERIMNEKSN